MKYTDNEVQFNDVKIGALGVATGPLTIKNNYTFDDLGNIESIDESLINAIDIDWGSATIGSYTINTTADLLNFIYYGGGSGNGSPSTPGGNNSELARKVSNLETQSFEFNRQIGELNTRLQELSAVNRLDVEDMLNNALSDYLWIKNYGPNSFVQIPMDWNDDLKAYVLYVIRTDADGNGATWSTIQLKFDSIELMANSIRIVDDDGGVLTIDQLTARIKTAIQTDLSRLSNAVAELLAAYNNIRTDLDGLTAEEIRYNIAGIRATADLAMAKADISAESVAKIPELNGDVTNLKALAASLYLTCLNLDNRIESAWAALGTKLDATGVNNLITQGQFISESNLDAKLETCSTITSMSASIGVNLSAIAGVQASVRLLSGGNQDAMAGLKAQLDLRYAAIGAYVTKDSNGHIETDVIIDADRIDINGLVTRLNTESVGLSLNSLLYREKLIVDYLMNRGIFVGKSNELKRAIINLYKLDADGTGIVNASDIVTIVNEGVPSTTGATIYYDGEGTINIRSVNGVKFIDDVDGDLNDIKASKIVAQGKDSNGNYLTSIFGDVKVNGTFSNPSDERLKNILEEVDPSIEDIANTRIVNFKYKDNNNTTYLGSIALDWLHILPYGVSTDENGYFRMNYPAIALVASVKAAREIVELKNTIAELKEEIKKLKK